MCATLALASPPRVRRAPALLDARALWVPRFAHVARRVAEADAALARDGDAWALRGASLAVWRGEVVCVAGSDLVALDALADCLAGATPAGGVVRARAAWWRAGRLLRAPTPGAAAACASALTARLCDAIRCRPRDGAVVCALALSDDARAWDALARAAARVAYAAPVRCVRLAAGRVVSPPRSVDPSQGPS